MSLPVRFPKLPIIFHSLGFETDMLTPNFKDLETANATVPGIPPNDLTACRVNGTDSDNGPFCSPIHGQNLWTGYTYGGKWEALSTFAESL